MRTIKFRAWDKENKAMMYVGKSIEFDNEERFSPLMQFTGLKDKNGKEIYEGDIVKISSSLAGRGKSPYYPVGEVIMLNGTWTIWDEGADYHTPLYEEDPEKIGNIYENPELIK